MLRDAAINWVQSHIAIPVMHRDFIRHFDRAATAGVNCHVIVGRGLTKNRKPYMVHCFAGELFLFQLSDGQVAAAGVAANAVKMDSGKLLDRVALVEKPQLTLSRLEVEGEAGHRADEPIIANVSYATGAECPTPMMARLDYDTPSSKSVRCFHYLHAPLPASGRLRCTFPNLSDEFVGKPARFPVAVFLRLFGPATPLQGNVVVPISNACATLVSLSPHDLEAHRASSLG